MVYEVVPTFELREWELVQLFHDVAFGNHVIFGIRLELVPLARVVVRHVPSPHPVGLGWLARGAEKPD